MEPTPSQPPAGRRTRQEASVLLALAGRSQALAVATAPWPCSVSPRCHAHGCAMGGTGPRSRTPWGSAGWCLAQGPPWSLLKVSPASSGVAPGRGSWDGAQPGGLAAGSFTRGTSTGGGTAHGDRFVPWGHEVRLSPAAPRPLCPQGWHHACRAGQGRGPLGPRTLPGARAVELFLLLALGKPNPELRGGSRRGEAKGEKGPALGKWPWAVGDVAAGAAGLGSGPQSCPLRAVLPVWPPAPWRNEAKRGNSGSCWGLGAQRTGCKYPGRKGLEGGVLAPRARGRGGTTSRCALRPKP